MTELERNIKYSTNEVWSRVYNDLERQLWRDTDSKLISPILRQLHPIEIVIEESGGETNVSITMLREYGKIK